MLPQYTDDLQNDFEMIVYPTATYYIDFENKCIAGKCDGTEAMKQMIYKALHTERYIYEMYSWDYGHELTDCIGVAIPLVYVRIKQAIIDALIYDDRIVSVDDFGFTRQGNRVNVKFTVVTSAKDNIDMEVMANV